MRCVEWKLLLTYTNMKVYWGNNTLEKVCALEKKQSNTYYDCRMPGCQMTNVATVWQRRFVTVQDRTEGLFPRYMTTLHATAGFADAFTTFIADIFLFTLHEKS